MRPKRNQDAPCPEHATAHNLANPCITEICRCYDSNHTKVKETYQVIGHDKSYQNEGYHRDHFLGNNHPSQVEIAPAGAPCCIPGMQPSFLDFQGSSKGRVGLRVVVTQVAVF